MLAGIHLPALAMPYNRLSTSKIARIVGCHPNTVLLYEQWGAIAPVPRGPNNYRLYSEEHLDQMRLARTVMGGLYPGRKIRKAAVKVIRLTVSGDLEAALEQANKYLQLIQMEQLRARKIADTIERWARGQKALPGKDTWTIKQTAQELELTVDQLRNWERNGLLNVPRDPGNAYRRYTQTELERLGVIDMLLKSGFGMAAVHRVMQKVDRGDLSELTRTLDTPDQDEIVYPSDQWLTTLSEQEQRAKRVISILNEMLLKR
jgi:DNA-binding transcriptional MerR regulator